MEQIETEELELNKVNDTLVNMTLFDEQESSYIIDLERVDGKIKITYADGHVEEDVHGSLHNLNYYRIRVGRQFREYYDEYMDEMGKESLKGFAKKYASVVVCLASLFFLYNIDIHIIIKIILSVGIVLGEIFYYFLKQYDLLVLSKELERVNAIEKYLDNQSTFEVYNEEEKDYDYSLAIDDVWKYDLTVGNVEDLINDANSRDKDDKVLRYQCSRKLVQK